MGMTYLLDTNVLFSAKISITALTFVLRFGNGLIS